MASECEHKYVTGSTAQCHKCGEAILIGSGRLYTLAEVVQIARDVAIHVGEQFTIGPADECEADWLDEAANVVPPTLAAELRGKERGA